MANGDDRFLDLLHEMEQNTTGDARTLLEDCVRGLEEDLARARGEAMRGVEIVHDVTAELVVAKAEIERLREEIALLRAGQDWPERQTVTTGGAKRDESL